MEKTERMERRLPISSGTRIPFKVHSTSNPDLQCFNIPVSILDEVERMCRNFYWGQKQNERRMAWVAWHKTQQSKKAGGLGMRDLRTFNKALLAKQAWRILTNKKSLLGRILKMKYFPNTDFMKAKVSPNASFTWRSICSARDIIEKGAMKVVGKGNTISIWKDPWVPTLPNFRVLQTQNTENEDLRVVYDLMQGDRWNVELLNSTFSTWEAQAIMCIPVTRYAEEDGWTWHLTKHGDFTVRSAYYKEMETRKKNKASSLNQHRECKWKRLWQARVPPKIKNFGWKVLHNAIPVKQNLCARGIEVDKMCSMCGSEEEEISHALMRCEEVRIVWYTSPLRPEVSSEGMRDFKEWYEQVH